MVFLRLAHYFQLDLSEKRLKIPGNTTKIPENSMKILQT
jgi:hypothetical protein